MSGLQNKAGEYMKRIGRHKRKKQKKILIIGSLSLLLFLCVGYAAFSTNLSLKAKGNIKEKIELFKHGVTQIKQIFILTFINKIS